MMVFDVKAFSVILVTVFLVLGITGISSLDGNIAGEGYKFSASKADSLSNDDEAYEVIGDFNENRSINVSSRFNNGGSYAEEDDEEEIPPEDDEDEETWSPTIGDGPSPNPTPEPINKVAGGDCGKFGVDC